MSGHAYPVWGGSWRDDQWARVHEPWDLLIIGGGITGAGLLLEAAREGLKAILVEQQDFAWGTSSRSGKLVHGGMRYIKQGKLDLTRTLLRERDRLIREAPGLVEPLEFVLPTYRHKRLERWSYAVGIRLYDLLRGHRRSWKRYGVHEVQSRIRGVEGAGLDGGYSYMDAAADDARLVLRVLREAAGAGATALNYVRAVELIRENGRVSGAEVTDTVGNRTTTLRARVVINATGAWADAMRASVGTNGTLRPLRGTHLIIPYERLPLPQAVSFRHPVDGRHLYTVPWEGATIFGCTDLDHEETLDGEPRASGEELSYLLEAVQAWLPGEELTSRDLVGAFAGVRPVVGSGRAHPSRERRDSVVWEEDGLITVISGKLTGFRPTVRKALKVARARLSGLGNSGQAVALFRAPEPERETDLSEPVRLRLRGRYGPDMGSLISAARDDELTPIPSTPVLWAELRWAARAEGVVHLDDLLLRRVRVGLVLPEGGAAQLPRIRAICESELGWDESRWKEEVVRYRKIWSKSYEVS